MPLWGWVGDLRNMWLMRVICVGGQFYAIRKCVGLHHRRKGSTFRLGGKVWLTTAS